MTGLIGRLEAAQLIERIREGSDRRRITVRARPEALKRSYAVWSPVLQAIDDTGHALSKEDEEAVCSCRARAPGGRGLVVEQAGAVPRRPCNRAECLLKARSRSSGCRRRPAFLLDQPPRSATTPLPPRAGAVACSVDASEQIDLGGQVSLVTGGATGIGTAACRGYAEAGSHVAVNHYPGDRDREEAAKLLRELDELGVESIAVECDVTDAVGVPKVVDRIIATWGRIGNVFSNAGLTVPTGPLHETDYPTFQKVYQIALDGSFLCFAPACPTCSRRAPETSCSWVRAPASTAADRRSPTRPARRHSKA